MTNAARGSTSSNAFIQALVGHQEDFFHGSDIVFLETFVNQVGIRDVAQKDDEVLMSLVTMWSRRVIKPTANGEIARGFTGTAVMWVVGSTRRRGPMW